MLTKIGLGSLAGGLALLLLEIISGFMEKVTFATDLTLAKLMGEDLSDSVAYALDVEMIQSVLERLIYDWPIYLLLFGMGILCLVVGMFVKNY